MMRTAFRATVLSSALLALMAWPAPRAVAQEDGNVDDGEAGQVIGRQLTVQGPVESIDCELGGITLYGQTYVFASPVSFHRNDNDATDGGTDGDQTDENAEQPGEETLLCTDVAVGDFVDVKLSGVDLTWMATEVGAGGGFCEDGDCGLGLVSGLVSGGTVNGIAIHVDPGIEGAELFVEGVYVEVTVEPGSPPLEALKIDNGDDVDEPGPDEIGTVEVTVLDATTGKPVRSGAIGINLAVTNAANKVVSFRTIGNGTVTLKGLPFGTAKLGLTRFVKGQKTTAKTSFSVPSTGTKRFRLRLQ